MFCRSPCGERGLKSLRFDGFCGCRRRSPCGERGLKYDAYPNSTLMSCRSPCGERGLKCACQQRVSDLVESLPVRGAWIEIMRGF